EAVRRDRRGRARQARHRGRRRGGAGGLVSAEEDGHEQARRDTTSEEPRPILIGSPSALDFSCLFVLVRGYSVFAASGSIPLAARARGVGSRTSNTPPTAASTRIV